MLSGVSTRGGDAGKAVLESGVGCMLDGGIADVEERDGSSCVSLRRSQDTVVERP